MTFFINEAQDLVSTISAKEAEVSNVRDSLNIEADKFGLVTVVAIEAYLSDIVLKSKGRKARAGQFLDVVCFEILGQKNKSGKGKKLAENAQKLVADGEFAEVIQNWAEASKEVTQESTAWGHIVSEAKREVADICDALEINSYNKLVAYLNPKEEVSDVDQLIALATKLAKANTSIDTDGHAHLVISGLLDDASAKARTQVDPTNVTPICSVTLKKVA
jgi:hypothetical protein